MTKIAILGSSGMLGHTLSHLLEKEFNVTSIGRSGSISIDATVDGDLERIDGFDFVINCIGVIWQAQNPSRTETFITNSRFPWLLSRQCKKTNARLIHVSTDCVFSGRKGNYIETDAKDAVDDYGLSKSLGEPDDCMVLRTSVIGREIVRKKSLLEWVISNRGGKIDGFTNHMWNGVTTDEYARIVSKIIKNDLFQVGIHHVFSETVSKYDLIKRIVRDLNLDIEVSHAKAEISVDRTLSTMLPLNDSLNIRSLDEMIAGLK